MTEDFLHFAWKFKRFRAADLRTTSGDPIRIISTGSHNHDGGPDFLNARLQIGDTEWVGHVEIHVRASDWIKHKHHTDRAYDNVVLHVVFQDDVPIKRWNGEPLATLGLQGVIEPMIYHKFRSLITNRDWIPCQNHLPTADRLILRSWLDRMGTERLEQKTSSIAESLEASNNSWEDVFYQRLARHFGMKVNDDAFEMLAKSLPIRVLARQKGHRAEVEALFFGQAGLLEGIFTDNYPQQLQRDYAHLRSKYQLEPVPGHAWQFLRLRPANFPTIRIAQLAALVHRASHLLSKVIEAESLHALRQLFEVDTSPYWRQHYRFDKLSSDRSKALGKSAIDNLLINVVAPMLFVYGRRQGREVLRQRALELLRQLPAEDTRITRKWNELQVESANAFDTQALLHLKRAYCTPKRCLECGVGNSILHLEQATA